MMDFTWQMGYANESFDVDWYRSCSQVRKSRAAKEEYLKYKDEPEAQFVKDYWASHGMKKDFYPCDLYTCGNRRRAHHYSVLSPIDAGGKKLAVIYFCHAGGQDPFEAETYGLAEKAVKDGFIYVCPNQYGPEEFDRIMKEMETAGYPMDLSRVYVMGFSGGSGSAGEIALAYPERVAGAAMMPGANAFNQMHLQEVPEAFLKNEKLRVPFLCAGGTCDGGDRWPLVDEICYNNFNNWMKYVAKVPDVEPLTVETSHGLMENSPSQVERRFGIKFHKEYINDYDDMFIYIGDFLNTDGTAIGRFCQVTGLPHEMLPVYGEIALAFFMKFSRNLETGALVYEAPKVDFRTWRPVGTSAGQEK